MSQKDDHKKKAYELLRASLYVPFSFPDWGEYDEYKLMREKLRERIYTVKDTEATYRVINHWEESGLMPEGVNEENREKEGRWRTFTLVELAWLKVVSRLRDFNLSLERIAHAKSQLIHWNKVIGYYPSFEYALAQALFSSKDTYVRVLANGMTDLVPTEQIEMDRIISGSKDMLLISLKSVLAEMGLTFPEIKNRLELTDEEFELFDEIRHRENDEVTARVKKGKINEIESMYTIMNPSTTLDAHGKAKRERMYGHVTFGMEDGDDKSVQVRKKKRFKGN